MKKWTREEINYILTNRTTKTYEEMANILGRTKKSVKDKLLRYGFKCPKNIVKQSMSLAQLNREMSGENNPNWKNGISNNNYHYKKLQKERYPERVRAREKVLYALKRGKLMRQPCEVCGETKTQAHHDDYSKPLEVRWLCKKHHDEFHKNNS